MTDSVNPAASESISASITKSTLNAESLFKNKPTTETSTVPNLYLNSHNLDLESQMRTSQKPNVTSVWYSWPEKKYKVGSLWRFFWIIATLKLLIVIVYIWISKFH